MGAIYLVRHGQAPAHAYGVGVPDPLAPGLTELGERQAHRTGRALTAQVRTFDAAISGDLPRQRATLHGVLSMFDSRPEVVVDPAWSEYALPPALSAVPSEFYADRARYQDELDQGLDRWIAGADEGTDETYAAFADRTRDAARRAAELAGTGRSVLVVSSAGTITQLIAQLWNVPDARWPTLSRTFVNASVTKLIAGGRGLTVVSVNEHAHLAGDLMTYR
ncbi:histidine phosphatase family protein [Gordonia zhaorongruii]|uniref:histidine phosphatase family protein n=1 Tax=Gordonia zhaorongruii TaxID=2597659 RepID=UPI00117CA207|nr:histidine phosphatase family protein [Gordonia zhaorongruii]